MAATDRQGMSVMLTCKDCPASVAYYRDVLGFELKESWPNEEAPHWANMVLQGQSVMLGAAMDVAAIDQMCAGDEVAKEHFRREAEAWTRNEPGIGLIVYLQVEDIDAYAAQIRAKGAKLLGEPKDQFYGIREQRIQDPSGYNLIAFTPITMQSCQSCGMPLQNADPGQMYCGHCTDEAGNLQPYEAILEGTIQGYFMGMQNMPRDEAEQAAKEHLGKMPAWAGR